MHAIVAKIDTVDRAVDELDDNEPDLVVEAIFELTKKIVRSLALGRAAPCPLTAWTSQRFRYVPMTLLTMLARLGAVLSLLLIGSRIVKRLNLFMFYARCGLGWLRRVFHSRSRRRIARLPAA